MNYMVNPIREVLNKTKKKNQAKFFARKKAERESILAAPKADYRKSMDFKRLKAITKSRRVKLPSRDTILQFVGDQIHRQPLQIPMGPYMIRQHSSPMTEDDSEGGDPSYGYFQARASSRYSSPYGNGDDGGSLCCGPSTYSPRLRHEFSETATSKNVTRASDHEQNSYFRTPTPVVDPHPHIRARQQPLHTIPRSSPRTNGNQSTHTVNDDESEIPYVGAGNKARKQQPVYSASSSDPRLKRYRPSGHRGDEHLKIYDGAGNNASNQQARVASTSKGTISETRSSVAENDDLQILYESEKDAGMADKSAQVSFSSGKSSRG